MSELLTPSSERWNEFITKLEGPEGCDFKQSDPNDTRSITWKCNNKEDRPFARKILEEMGGIDIEKTLEYFSEHGGYCDCEIVFNVEPINLNENE